MQSSRNRESESVDHDQGFISHPVNDSTKGFECFVRSKKDRSKPELPTRY